MKMKINLKKDALRKVSKKEVCSFDKENRAPIGKDKIYGPIPKVLIEQEILSPDTRCVYRNTNLNRFNDVVIKLSKSKRMKEYSKGIKRVTTTLDHTGGHKDRQIRQVGMNTKEEKAKRGGKEVHKRIRPNNNITPEEAENRLLFWIDKIQSGKTFREADAEFREVFNLKGSNTTRAWRDKALRVLDLYIVDKAADIKNSNIVRLEKILSNAYEMGDYKLALNTIDLLNKTAGIYKQNETNVNIQTPDSNFKFTFGGIDVNNNTNKVEDVEIEEVN